jgi:hypothetical protein
VKKLLLLSALLIFACSSADSPSDDSNDGDVILCTKRTRQYERNGEQITRTYEYEYAGTQLLRWVRTTTGYANPVDGNETQTFTNIYEGNLVTSLTRAIDYQSDGTVNWTYSYEFEYDNLGRKIKQIWGGEDQYFYNYLNDGLTVQITDSEGLLDEIQTYDSNKNLVEKEYFDSNGLYNGSTIYTHDDKNMPFKNVTTWNPLSFYLYISPNNTISTQSDNCIYTDDITYDDNDYPVSIISSSSCDERIQTYTLEYNN